jgi:hypothetical protein
MRTFRVELHAHSGDDTAYTTTGELYAAIEAAILSIPKLHMVTVDAIDILPSIELPGSRPPPAKARPKLVLRSRTPTPSEPQPRPKLNLRHRA